MVARLPVANVFKIEFAGTLGPFPWAIILHAGWAGATPTSTICAAIASQLATSWGTNLAPRYNAETILETVTLTDLTSATAASGTHTAAIPGSGAGAFGPGNAAVLVVYPSSFRYRGGHPRTYLPGPSPADMINQANLTTAAVTAYTTDFGVLQALLATASSGGTNLSGQCAVSYIYSTPVPGTVRPTPLVMPIATGAFTVEAKLASQRRRIGRK